MPDANVFVLSSFRERLNNAVPQHLTDVDIYKIGIAASLRHATTVLRTLYGTNIEKLIAKAKYDKICITPAELGSLVQLVEAKTASTPTDLATRMCAALENENSLHKQSIITIGTALSTTLLPDKNKRSWEHPLTRCAAALAARTRHTQSYLDAVVGHMTKLDMRRLNETTEDMECQEDESDAHLYVTCIAIEALACSVVNVVGECRHR